ncbi:transglycosylase SLT domain-containing protein [Enterovibrio coralii]|uniref:Murein transglycosylase n=1 Tax=Enterovibrio coralii TaxID=294935 RepID=A0A135IC76_9GAMM|nr:transglycosylase SLT domain-containing protein [Enterovibrio coralii]KXF83039.1 murein transglycosylase [Enterovibrio coralii]
MNQNHIKALALAVAVALSSPLALANDPFDELERESTRVSQSQQEKIEEFHAWLDNYLTEYETWRDDYTRNLDKERAQLINQWGSGEVSGSTKAVEYDSANTLKKVVDYENNEATISVLVDAKADGSAVINDLESFDIDGQTISMTNAVKEVALVDYSASQEKKEKQFVLDQLKGQLQELDVQANRLVNSGTGIPDSFIYERAYKKKLALIEATKPRLEAIAELFSQKRRELGLDDVQESLPKPELPKEEPQKENKQHKVEAAPELIEEKVQDASTKNQDRVELEKEAVKEETQQKPEVNLDIDKTIVPVKVEKKVVSYKVKLPENALKQRASQFTPLVEEESERWGINAALIMAIMHSESSFRPTAKSHVPAYGLMQVVPTSAGHDVNKKFRQIDAPMKSDDLYVPTINVETGTAYLNILDKSYLKSITNDESRMYCVIAAYNTGAGNVARAFNKDRSTNIRKAATVINSMTPDQVYQHLLENLPYDETRNYLQKVNSRIALYK